ncbi:MAG: alpha/beta hydrolase [Eggerthellaceae bacterium]|nr:alpha/beta hydrolase [Eggerthellaceae bacterium]
MAYGYIAELPEAIEAQKQALAAQRWADFEAGEQRYAPSFPEVPYPNVDALPETDPLANELMRFYAVPRGHHPNARGGFTDTSMLSMMQFSCLQYIAEISPRPLLFITGDRAHSRSFSEKAYCMAAEPKELFIVEGAEHIDLYDGGNGDFIPFDKLEEFFAEAFR